MTRTIFLGILILFSLITGAIIFCSSWIAVSTKDQVFSAIDQVPDHKVGLVLGTNRYTGNNYLNPYFTNRIEAAAALYQAGKIKHIIVSGDNNRKNYNEPVEMQKALEKKGVPTSAITLDFAGFRTLDSVVRCKEVFQQDKFVIVSQKFHNHRAVFIANKYNLKTVSFNAADPAFHQSSFTQFREYLARVKAVLDLYILRKKPKFLGGKIDLEV